MFGRTNNSKIVLLVDHKVRAEPLFLFNRNQ